MALYSDLRYATHPRDSKNYDTQTLRDEYLIDTLFTPDDIRLTYSLFDRLIVGGIMPVHTELELTPIDELKADYFAERREIGIINVGGTGTVTVDNTPYPLSFKEALYIGRGHRHITFKSDDPASPAKFYLNSAPAHTSYPTTKVTKDNAIIVELGTQQECNHRIINKLLVKEVLPTCQLQMGMTELQPGNVWNTMPPHTHNRRMEAYFYFDIDDAGAICHFMGEPDETRHLWMKRDQAVISPSWSIHSACATRAYTFIWGMCGENLDYGDMDTRAATDLK